MSSGHRHSFLVLERVNCDFDSKKIPPCLLFLPLFANARAANAQSGFYETLKGRKKRIEQSPSQNLNLCGVTQVYFASIWMVVYTFFHFEHLKKLLHLPFLYASKYGSIQRSIEDRHSADATLSYVATMLPRKSFVIG